MQSTCRIWLSGESCSAQPWQLQSPIKGDLEPVHPNKSLPNLQGCPHPNPRQRRETSFQVSSVLHLMSVLDCCMQQNNVIALAEIGDTRAYPPQVRQSMTDARELVAQTGGAWSRDLYAERLHGICKLTRPNLPSSCHPAIHWPTTWLLRNRGWKS
jgi:hypothetical protein